MSVSESTAAIILPNILHDPVDNELLVSDEKKANYVSASSMCELRFHRYRIPASEEHNSDPQAVSHLNEFLQRRRHLGDHGNLTHHFSWDLQHEGPDHQRQHIATAKREPLSRSDNWALSSSCAVHGQIIGSGRGLSVRNAKQEAASQALAYLTSLPENDPLFSL